MNTSSNGGGDGTIDRLQALENLVQPEYIFVRFGMFQTTSRCCVFRLSILLRIGNVGALGTTSDVCRLFITWSFAGVAAIGDASRLRFRSAALSSPIMRHSDFIVFPSNISTRKSGSLRFCTDRRFRIAEASSWHDSNQKNSTNFTVINLRFTEKNKFRWFTEKNIRSQTT